MYLENRLVFSREEGQIREEKGDNQKKLTMKPLHCEVHRQEGAIALPGIAQCLWLEQVQGKYVSTACRISSVEDLQ